ncbi:haloacid dehalogenase superfamily, subfamily IA, variant 1 with third motif having Dx(3-4)D or Dx(3-4)E [Pseudobutyrivibrio sp. ACV-2]|uniref:HAD-IA family hydrolase n=1 Tax=Pseudobutyrivibrio sp. ACV-2 TaxID=1520801 RepID=UPI000896C570|nr:HAD-IA family hydrolase [Pseudobutyrivibrio sp. ACV-2]SEA30089.1 haloacid dehalogenase superfamily, subfamily IA, variant 1 with third motif having Dx(3-4)D or Dx(3-4)E [Pseudobutyrivibrio sp. ACV-2]
MRLKIYNFLVNKHIGIRKRYHAFHDNSTGIIRMLSWVYLLWLNCAYYCLFMHSLGKDDKTDVYEYKNIESRISEMAHFKKEYPDVCVDRFVEKLLGFDVVSFDIFDTLIFRPFSEPADLFYLIGCKLDFLNFKDLRARAEFEARLIRAESQKIKNKKKKQSVKKQQIDYEVDINDIWSRMSDITGIDAVKGKAIEEELEYELCYANPFMLQVFKELQARGKRIVITSDMYLTKDFLVKMLKKNGYDGYEYIFVSNEYHKSKSDGRLYDVVKNKMGNELSYIHVGDNVHSDIKMAEKHGFNTLYYPNVNRAALLYRTYDMSPIIGGAYRGVVNNRIYSGVDKKTTSMEYEYGYIYGGLFSIGYCAYIHEYARLHNIDKILFLSRDGDTLKQVYEIMYPEETLSDKIQYVYWSRKAATILTYDLDKNDYFRRFLYHKINQKYTILQILSSMELEKLADKIEGYSIVDKDVPLIGNEGRKIKLHLSDELTDKNVEILRVYIEENFGRINEQYLQREKAAKLYYKNVLDGVTKALLVDIGWAGSGAIAIRRLCHEKWDIPCEIIGMIAGTNTVHNVEPYQTETFLQSGVMNAYLYSQSFNRDLLKKHDPAKDYNVFWELILGSPTRQFKGFKSLDNGAVGYDFGDYDDNLEGIKETQQGILDFCKDYITAFGSPENGQHKLLYRISGRDAYAPILAASGNKEKYLKAIRDKFKLEPNVV